MMTRRLTEIESAVNLRRLLSDTKQALYRASSSQPLLTACQQLLQLTPTPWQRAVVADKTPP